MTFYKNCLSAELTFQSIEESPIAEQLPVKMLICILHAVLTNDEIVIMATDMVDESGLIKGNSVSMMLNLWYRKRN